MVNLRPQQPWGRNWATLRKSKIFVFFCLLQTFVGIATATETETETDASVVFHTGYVWPRTGQLVMVLSFEEK